MPERPLLLFPTPQPADRTKQKPQFGRVHKPNVTRQGQRLSPMFNQLQAAFEARRVEIQQNTQAVWLWRGLWGPPSGPYTIERLKIEEWFRDGRLADRARDYDGFYE